MPERSKEIILVGYFLSRFGYNAPPVSLKTTNWKDTYNLFYSKLNGGRTPNEFEHSLKNTRDGFDGYFSNNNREGWKNKSGKPAKLKIEAQEIFDQFKDFTEEEVYKEIFPFIEENKIGEIHLLNYQDLAEVGIFLSQSIINRFISSLFTKPFVILNGLSGSGKTKLAQAFAMWISENKEQYALVPVGADWTNREPLLGYPNSLNALHYVKPDSEVLDILIRAYNNYILNNKNLSKCKPYFLILDEMNLSHVERYFADFLSTMESGDEIKLYSGTERYAELDANNNPINDTLIPNTISLPKNLFIIGTVNIDETTYMFSPKVLDRANTIEFRISALEMEGFYKASGTLNMDALVSMGSHQASQFMQLAAGEGISINRLEHKDTFLSFFETLQSAGAEFGYRTANEMTKLVAYLTHFGMTNAEAYDIAIMQKLLPKLHGSRSKLNKILPKLIELCVDEFPISWEKLERMKKNAEDNGFASYAEA